jgi:hypothetical protein
MPRLGTRSIVLVVMGMLATAASAAIGLRALMVLFQPVDELDGAVPRPLLDPGAKGPLLGLAPGQRAQVRYRSRGCFHSIDRNLSFARDDDGWMHVEVTGIQPWDREDLHERVLTESQVLALDQELLFAQELHGGNCTTREEYEVSVFEGARRLSHVQFANEACLAPDRPAGGVTLWTLAKLVPEGHGPHVR